MKAMVFDDYGGPEVLHLVEHPKPAPGPGQVVIMVQATSVNPADWRLRSGQFKFGMRLRLPFTPGNDLSGFVEATGDGVTGLAPGDRVFAMTPLKVGGACAEFAAVDARLVAKAPSDLALEQAATLPLAGLTALQALRDHGRLQPGQALLVVGASGGVGHFATQIARSMGARVSALCSPRSEAMVRSLGAEAVYDYGDPASYAGPERFDMVFDAVNKEGFRRWRHVLRKGGVVVTVNPIIGKILPDVIAAMLGVSRLRSFFVRPSGADLLVLKGLVDRGAVRPMIQSRFALDKLAQAHALSAQGRVQGKLLIDVAQS